MSYPPRAMVSIADAEIVEEVIGLLAHDYFILLYEVGLLLGNSSLILQKRFTC
jgi:hypothetical protein